ncbi:conserved hypothetical protein [Sphingomonas gellani]|uniref:Phytanoyl-CoA dioxygenase (PhyH) n=1 Tax=Sphingomonas gellani TaxID=1166340 RepID=A0A1H8CPB5_9SPHN|nr:TIGR02466 family protein [Sphingomonas gellani]SEM95967.1 conserved hypothetical protein [Sphingomonas gellani]
MPPAARPDMLRLKADMLPLFETVVMTAHVADHGAIDAQLAAAIRDRMAADEGLNRSNIGGWHSRTDMLEWGGAPAERVADAAIRAARRLSHFEDRDPASIDWSVRMWANVSPPGALNMSHAHPGVLWAAVYYVDRGADPGEDAGGELYLEDPRFPMPLMTFPGFRAIGADGRPQSHERTVTTGAGDLVLFPGYLRHGVRPHRGLRDRISIAMNLYAREKAA